MYAVIETGGKQYRVELGTELEVDQLDVEPGQSVTIDRVLLVADGDDTSIGRPLVSDAAVDAEVVRRDRGAKLIVYKYGPKTRRRVKKGHRQELTVLRITDLRVGGRSAADAARKADRDAKTERQRLEEAAARQAAEDAALAAKLAERSKAETDTEAKPKTGRTRATKPASAAGASSTKTRQSKATTKAPKTAAETESAGPDAPTARSRTKASSPTDAKASPDTPKRGRSKKSE
jgi:large subunit ribosomal protein L21